MSWYETIIAAHTAVTDQVSHLERMRSERYFVWQEDGRNDLEADGEHVETAVTGSTDLYTRQELLQLSGRAGDRFLSLRVGLGGGWGWLASR